MSTLKAIAYISRTNKEFTAQELDQLLIDARNFNSANNITGVLLHNPGFFYQYIEGPSYEIHQTYERIKAASGHQIIMELYNDVVDKRYCSDWHMGFCNAPKGFIQELSQKNWVANVPKVKQHASMSEGLEMLMTFWGNMASKAA